MFTALKAACRAVVRARVQPQLGYLDAIRAVLPRDGFFVEEISQVGFASSVSVPRVVNWSSA